MEKIQEVALHVLREAKKEVVEQIRNMPKEYTRDEILEKL